MSTAQEVIPGQPRRKKKVGYNLSADVVRDLANLRRKHRINLSEFVEASLRESLLRYSGRKPSPTQPAA